MAREPNRRQFFADGLRSIISPLADLLDPSPDAPAEPATVLPLTVLRPPGALPEPEFLDTCQRCGACVTACPADAIRLFASPDPRLNNTPVIDPDQAACVICDELACMKECPSGALRLVDAVSEIRMGLAHLRVHACLRTHGEECTECVDRCPLGSTAIQIAGSGRIQVHLEGCVGCGVCQLYCPTRPRAIIVRPA